MHIVIDAVCVTIVVAIDRGTKQNGRRKLRSIMGHKKAGPVVVRDTSAGARDIAFGL
jgi:hypothetical protein